MSDPVKLKTIKSLVMIVFDISSDFKNIGKYV